MMDGNNIIIAVTQTGCLNAVITFEISKGKSMQLNLFKHFPYPYPNPRSALACLSAHLLKQKNS